MNLNRRQFIQAGAAAGAATLAGLPLDANAAKPTPFIDCHTHIYDPTRPQGVPWPPREDARLHRRVLGADIRKVAAKHGVKGTVVVEASEWLADNDWVLEQAKKDRFIVGFIGRIALEDPDFEKHLRRLSRNPLFRGIRVRGQNAPRIAEPAAERALGLLADFELALDFNCLPGELPLVSAIAKKAPKLRIVVNHLANLTVNGKPPPQAWMEAMTAAAQNDQVFLKISGLVEGTRRDDFAAPRALDFYRPVLDAATEVFGVDRLLFSSNWPVSELFAPYDTVIGNIQKYYGEKGAQALAKVGGENSRRAYRWADRK
jgi:predicted TIM-barrel fold metal-dependent hydrolase